VIAAASGVGSLTNTLGQPGPVGPDSSAIEDERVTAARPPQLRRWSL